jgi:hypothetical protein
MLGVLGSSAALAVPAVAVHRAPDFIAVPREAWEAVEAWAAAHRASVAATNAYGDYLRPIGERREATGGPIYPAEKAECDRLYAASCAASEEVGPARERMIFALLKATRGDA